METEAKTKELTLKQQRFCELFATDRDVFGNGTQAYIEAYPDATPESARRLASQLLTNVDILRRIDELLEFNGLNDQNVDKQLAIVIQQNSDYGAKVAAMREYNKLRARITEKQSVEVSNPDGSLKPDGGTIAALLEAVKGQTAKPVDNSAE